MKRGVGKVGTAANGGRARATWPTTWGRVAFAPVMMVGLGTRRLEPTRNGVGQPGGEIKGRMG